MSLIYHFRPATPNIGNDLIVMALQNLVAESSGFPRNLINMPAKGATSVIKNGGLTRQTVNDINQMGAGVLIGPGNLFENNGLDVDPVALGALRVAPLVFGVSWGRTFDDAGELRPRTDAMRAETIAALCEKAVKVLVRDEPTQRYLEEIGVDGAKVIGCPVLAIEPDRLPLPGPDPRVTGRALISVRSPLLMNISPRLQGRVHFDVRRIIDALRAMGHREIALVCHDPRDLRFAAAYPDVPALYTESPVQFLSWLRDCSLCVTFRLHSFLPCALLGTPSVHFSYDERAMGLIDVARLQGCDIDYVRSADPVARAMSMCREPESLARTAASARPSWSELRRVMVSELTAWMAQMDRSS